MGWWWKAGGVRWFTSLRKAKERCRCGWIQQFPVHVRSWSWFPPKFWLYSKAPWDKRKMASAIPDLAVSQLSLMGKQTNKQRNKHRCSSKVLMFTPIVRPHLTHHCGRWTTSRWLEPCIVSFSMATLPRPAPPLCQPRPAQRRCTGSGGGVSIPSRIYKALL